jgi:hypothetical protein
MSEVKIVRLTSGEELIAKTEQIDNISYILKKPAILIPAGKDQLAFGQWLPYADIDDGIEILSKFVVFVVDPMEEMKQQYEQAFGSGLVVPSAGGIQGAPLPSLKLTD